MRAMWCGICHQVHVSMLHMAHGERSQNVKKVRGSFLFMGSNQGRDYGRRIRWKKEKENNEKRRKRKRKAKKGEERKEMRKKKRKGRKERK